MQAYSFASHPYPIVTRRLSTRRLDHKIVPLAIHRHQRLYSHRHNRLAIASYDGQIVRVDRYRHGTVVDTRVDEPKPIAAVGIDRVDFEWHHGTTVEGGREFGVDGSLAVDENVMNGRERPLVGVHCRSVVCLSLFDSPLHERYVVLS